MKIYISVFFLICLLYTLWRSRAIRKKRHHRKQEQARRVINRLANIPAFPQKIAYLRKVDPFTFEEIVLEGFERKGFTVIRNKRYTGDGGIDGKVIIDSQTCFLQAKRYTGFISPSHVNAFSQLCEAHNTGGFFCHTGKTSKPLMEKIKTSDRIIIVSGERLINLISIES
ncbi:restriction endonuclease [Salmonella enterica]|nr:restriction endonuclease [Salmonella enterica]EJB9345405.1 restriction endonuclease [Salmonella enterica]